MSKNWYFQFSHPGALIEVNGEDAYTFLQGQYSNDLRLLSSEPSLYGLWLDRRGRIQGDSFICCLQPMTDNIILKDYLLFSPGTPAAVIESHLDRHIIADDVFLKDRSKEYIMLSVFISGPSENPGELTEWFEQAGFVNEFHRAARIADGRFAHCRVMHWPVSRTVDQIALRASLYDWGSIRGIKFLEQSDIFEKQRILEQVPSIPGDLNADNLPHDGNLKEGEAFSLNKGCYLGQEVMLRKKSADRMSKSLLCYVSDCIIKPGDSVYSQSRLAGKITSVMAHGQSWLSLVLLRNSQVDESRFLSLDEEGKQLIHRFESFSVF